MKFNKIILVFLTVFFIFTITGCNTDKGVDIDLDKEAYYNNLEVKPFWLTDTMYEETVEMVKYNKTDTGGGYLAYNPLKILKVTNYSKSETYVEGTDYEVNGNQIYLTANSKISALNYSDLIGNEPLGILPQYSSESFRNQGLYIYYAEWNSLLTANQIRVTYQYDNTKVVSKAKYFGDKLTNTLGKLNSGEKLNILIHGDSISYGCNATSYLKEAPYMDTWYELLKKGLTSKYSSEITLKNTSVGGTTSSWGAGLVDFGTVKADLKKNVVDQNPDLVVLGFGMNDGSANVAIETYISNIKKIIDDTRKELSKPVEFLIINTMLPSPMSSQDTGMHKQYKQPLQTLCNSYEGCEMVDMSAIQEELLQEKFYADLLSNNINHPNDFFVRVYAMNLLSALIKY